MPRLFFFHLLGVCLLLNQFSRAVADSWMDEVIKLCGRELVRAQIAICGMSSLGKRSLSQEDAPQTPRPVAGDFIQTVSLGISPDGGKALRTGSCFTREFLGALSKLCHPSSTKIQKP
ncbi:prorelaxin H2 isoform X1 [Pan troglodytes]|nr:prorelaxin H2 isoform X2 [Pan troglodytes]